MKTRYFIYSLSSVLALLFSCNKFNKILKSSDYELKYTKAIEYYNKGNYTSAQTLLEELIPVYKGTPRAEEVYYYYCYSHYYLGEYSLAGFHFRTFYRSFHQSTHIEECAFMNAFCYFLSSPRYSLDQADTKNAIQELQDFLTDFPDSKRLDTCNFLIDKLRGKLEKKSYEIAKGYFFRDDWRAAITSSQNFVKDFPESHFVEEMQFLVIKSYFLLAKFSVISKKAERIDKGLESYLKFVDLHPQSIYLKEAEVMYYYFKQNQTINPNP